MFLRANIEHIPEDHIDVCEMVKVNAAEAMAFR